MHNTYKNQFSNTVVSHSSPASSPYSMSLRFKLKTQAQVSVAYENWVNNRNKEISKYWTYYTKLFTQCDIEQFAVEISLLDVLYWKGEDCWIFLSTLLMLTLPSTIFTDIFPTNILFQIRDECTTLLQKAIIKGVQKPLIGMYVYLSHSSIHHPSTLSHTSSIIHLSHVRAAQSFLIACCDFGFNINICELKMLAYCQHLNNFKNVVEW